MTLTIVLDNKAKLTHEEVCFSSTSELALEHATLIPAHEKSARTMSASKAAKVE